MKHIGSIKSRLIVIMLVCVVGMSILAINQIYNTHRLIELNNQGRLLLKLNNDLLQLRRHEKDFLLRLDSQYAAQFNIRANKFNQELSQLHDLSMQSSISTDWFDNVQQGLTIYQELFNQLVQLHTDMGLDAEAGYQGEFRQANHQLENQLQAGGKTYSHLILLQLRRAEKDFLLRLDMQYIEKQNQLYQSLREELITSTDAQSNAQISLLDNYQAKFMQLVNTQKTLGLDHESGLQGEFRRQAHLVEAELSMLDTKVKNILLQEESKIERISIVIMFATLLALVILLVKSFTTLQKAFATFVMFFYRCKREYQHIDERKQGFAEFKYLAMIANEMIDARQEIEQELKKSQQEVERLRSSHSINA
ncbi:hypothetical protein [Paraglaciecola sp.]|uniref:hypothetical protein n=1 Tax=Paraglaciecola sp. TaxID=1920173 RepID=UPI003EF338A4